MTQDQRMRSLLGVGLLLGLLACTGCVRRTLTIRTEPAGALVYVNDEEIGRSPASTDFVWYGDYDIIVRKDGYQTLRTHAKVNPPWYQVPPVDFFAEVLYIGKLHDQHELAYTLESEQLPGPDEVIEHAETLRDDAMAGPR